MITEDAFSQVLKKISAVPLREDLWPDALRSISDLFGSGSAHFEVIDKRTCTPLFHKFDRLSDESVIRYREYFSGVSPRTKDGAIRPAGHIGYDHSVLSEIEMAKDEFYEDFLRPQGLRYFVPGHMMNNNEYYGVFSVQRRIGEGHAESNDLALMEKLLPHLSQAVQIQLKIAAADDQARGSRFLFENSDTGAIFMGRRGCVVSTNAAAEQLIADPTNELDISQGRLFSREGRQTSEIERLISDTIQTGAGQGVKPGTGIPLSRRGALPLSLVAMPLPNFNTLVPLTGAPVAVLLISVPAQSPKFSTELLQALFSLTPAECRLAQALYGGQTPADYATLNCLSIRTVRTHLSNILHKTGARNQVELVRMLGITPNNFM